ncbi:permease for cytosine/purines, uracil, thiamine, allantoin [Hirsutella rhossiliensis]|uniref:Permease for cytosine/purines, uracil, thiamine, allantoin n=1 Tax=Hirsutella rhossiliensis TaxID=111463 RepID=A0A9P8SEY8_9HYPO|nr:permease for cytosine/purines, uracil, thiamine, allantoin [Hirsutella rhossiliensis]KAH0960181.1 permease for cytosine/purines, uracil, thiamine, allantoin [Hirsutella rhossiliensis]
MSQAGADKLHQPRPGTASIVDSPPSPSAGLLHRILRLGRVEQNGIRPLPPAERRHTRFFNIFTVWFSINSNILGITFGMLGPSLYGLGLRDSALVILFFCLLSTLAPAALAILGPKTGMRQMIQARYSFGRYLVSIPVLLNLATLTGFTVIICVVGGQCISAVSDGTLTPNLGIVIIALLSLLVSFAGFTVLHIFETYAFVAALVSIAIAAGVGGDGLAKQSQPDQPPTARQVLNFGMIVASYQLPWAAIASDLTTYFDPKVPSSRVFHYTYWGLLIPTVLLMTLGAAVARAIPNNPDWEDRYGRNLVGGALAGMLAPAGGFGKFVVVVLALSLLGNTCGTFYAISLNFQTLVPWLARVPRYVFSIVTTAVVIPVAIAAVDNFLVNLENFVALIGYWSAAFVGIVAAEHLVFRRGRYDAYDHAVWNSARRLPLGAAALGAGVVCFGLVVPCMDQAWWTGPIAKTTGDIGFEVAFVVSALTYVPLRHLEKRFTGR